MIRNNKCTRFLTGILTLAIFLSAGNSFPTNAMSINTTSDLNTDDNVLKEKVSLKDDLTTLKKCTKNNLKSSIVKNKDISFLAETGDGYEVNDGPDTATTGRYNLVTYASLHDTDLADWYEMDISDASEPISIVLTNIPANCDYDVYLVEYSPTTGIGDVYANISTGNASEELIGYVQKSGTYYVVVQPSDGIENNYSDSNYKLYFGDYIRTKSYGYESTGLNIDFGYVKPGNTTPVYKYWYAYDLTNSTQIPDGAAVDSIYLSSDGNGNSWVGFYKMLGYGNGATLATKSGGISLMYSVDENATQYYEAKQKWLIGGYVSSSTYFIWQPKMRIVYLYGVNLNNLRFV